MHKKLEILFCGLLSILSMHGMEDDFNDLSQQNEEEISQETVQNVNVEFQENIDQTGFENLEILEKSINDLFRQVAQSQTKMLFLQERIKGTGLIYHNFEIVSLLDKQLNESFFQDREKAIKFTYSKKQKYTDDKYDLASLLVPYEIKKECYEIAIKEMKKLLKKEKLKTEKNKKEVGFCAIL